MVHTIFWKQKGKLMQDSKKSDKIAQLQKFFSIVLESF